MRRIFLVTVMAALTLLGCGRDSAVRNSGPQGETLFYVTFEGSPKVVEGEPVVRGGLELGKVLIVTVPNPKVTVAQIAIHPGNEIWMRGNIAFYLQNDQMHYAELTEKGRMVASGAKFLGFAGKAQLYWFKSKAPVNEVVKIAQIKAERLYRQAAL